MFFFETLSHLPTNVSLHLDFEQHRSVLTFFELDINGTIQYLLSVSGFLCSTWRLWGWCCRCICGLFILIPCSADRHWGSFQFRAVTNSAAMDILTRVSGAHVYAFLFGAYIGMKELTGQRRVLYLALVDTAKQVFNVIVSNRNILNYFPVDFMPGVVTTEQKPEHLKQPPCWSLSTVPSVLDSTFCNGRDHQIVTSIWLKLIELHFPQLLIITWGNIELSLHSIFWSAFLTVL